MRPSVFIVSVSALALLASGGAAMAQTAPELAIGATVNGELDGQDMSHAGDGEDGGYRYEDHSFRARAGQRLEATLRSDAFDAYLQVFAAGTEDAGEALAEDDDGLGEDTDSRVRFVAPQDGTYTLRARTLGGLEGGAFTLALSERPPAPRAPRPTAIRIGSPVQGALASGDPEADDDTGRYDAYVFRARANERFAISLDAQEGDGQEDAFDPVVRVGRMERNAFVELAMNDDAASGGLNSYLIFTAPSAGDYVIRAAALGATDDGAYTLTLAEAPPPLAATPIAIGASVEGELSESDGINDGGARADAYSFTAAAGQRIEATLNAEAFDAYLELFDASGESLDQDDDGGEEGTNSRLVHTLGAAGDYTLQVRSIGDASTGAYTLALAEAAPEPEPSALPFAEVVQGEIKTTAARDDDGRGYDAWTFSGTEGNRVQVVMRSGDFDTFLQIGRAGAFDALASDDDGLGEGTDSRLNYILPETGQYVLRASPLGSDGKGLYSLELTDKGPQPKPGSILVGATARGTLTDSDAIADDGASFDAYAVNVADGEKLEITLVSNDFDAYLDVGKENDGAWESVVSDDDSLSDTHARVDWTVEDGGAYVIRARSFASGETGAYALTVARQP